MKVCILSGYPPSVGRGAESTNIYVSELANNSGVEKIIVISNLAEGYSRVERYGKIEIVRIWSPDLWASMFKVLKELIQVEADVYHIVYGYLFYGKPFFSTIFILLILGVLKIMRKPVVVTIHQIFSLNDVDEEFRKIYPTKMPRFLIKIGFIALNKLIGGLTSKIIAQYSKRHMDILMRDYGVKNVVFIHAWFVKSRSTMPKRRAKSILGFSGKNILLIFGFLAPYKGVEYAISAMPMILSEIPNAMLIIAGSVMPAIAKTQEASDYVQKIRREIQVSRCKNHIFFDDSYIPEERVNVYFSAADVLILPNVKQTGPSEILKIAYLSKIPPIATNIDYFRLDILENKTGLLIPPGDAESLANAVINLIKNRKLRKDIIFNIEQASLEFDITTVTKNLIHLYKSVIGEGYKQA